MAEKILVVEDEPSLVETLRYSLKRQGYQVLTTGNGLAALELARKEKPDLILLDIMLPGLDGIEVCRTLRQETATPIIMLTARDEEVDKVVGLEIGADDYVTKPFSMRELMARVKAQLRRVHLTREEASAGTASGEAQRLVFGDLVVDLGRREALKGGKPLPLARREFELLAYLARNRGLALSRERILEQVWGWDFAGGTRTVDVHVRGLREKIEDDPAHPTRLVTVRGSGYRFEP